MNNDQLGNKSLKNLRQKIQHLKTARFNKNAGGRYDRPL